MTTRMFFALLLTATAASAGAQNIDQVSVYAIAGQSIRTWHGQAQVQALNFELSRALSRRTEAGLVISVVEMHQPRSWFGDQFNDGNENVHAGSVSMLLRRKFNVDSSRLHFFAEGSSGPMWAEKPVPAETSRFNFVTQVGAGIVLRPRARMPLMAGYRYMHISNGGYSPRNPGLNVYSFVLGVRMRR